MLDRKPFNGLIGLGHVPNMPMAGNIVSRLFQESHKFSLMISKISPITKFAG
jgi:hypothetical protein